MSAFLKEASQAVLKGQLLGYLEQENARLLVAQRGLQLCPEQGEGSKVLQPQVQLDGWSVRDPSCEVVCSGFEICSL